MVDSVWLFVVGLAESPVVKVKEPLKTAVNLVIEVICVEASFARVPLLACKRVWYPEASIAFA